MARKAKAAVEMNSNEREMLNKLIGSVLDRYSVGDVNRGEAIDEIAQFVVSARDENWRAIIETRLRKVA